MARSRLYRYRRLRAALVEARQEAGLTQAELAGRLGKPQSYVAKYETGNRRIKIIEFLDICEAIGVDSAEILRRL